MTNLLICSHTKLHYEIAGGVTVHSMTININRTIGDKV